VTSIFEATNGNPLFVGRGGEDAGGEAARWPASPSAAGLTLPFGVREAIRQHLGRLSEAERAVVEVAVGPRPRRAHGAAGGGGCRCPRSSSRRPLARAVALGVLVERGRHPLRLRPRSHLRGALSRPPNSRRMELHARVAEALESRPERIPSARGPSSPTTCWRPAPASSTAPSPAPSAPRSRRWTRPPTRTPSPSWRRREAARSWPLPRRGPARSSAWPRAWRARARRRHHARTGALSAGRDPGPGDRRQRALRPAWRWGMAPSSPSGSVDPQLVALAARGAAALPEADSSLRARVMARLAPRRSSRRTGPSEPIQAGPRGHRHGRGSATGHLLAVIHAGMAAMMDFVHPDQRLPLQHARPRALAAELGDRPRPSGPTPAWSSIYLERGDLERADAQIETHERLARSCDPRACSGRRPLLRAMRATMEGRFADAERLTEEARAVGDEAAIARSAGTLCSCSAFGRGRAARITRRSIACGPSWRAMWNAAHWPSGSRRLEGRHSRPRWAAGGGGRVPAPGGAGKDPGEGRRRGAGDAAETCAARPSTRAGRGALSPPASRSGTCSSAGASSGCSARGPTSVSSGCWRRVWAGRRRRSITSKPPPPARATGPGPATWRGCSTSTPSAGRGRPARGPVSLLVTEAHALAGELGLTGLTRQIDALAGDHRVRRAATRRRVRPPPFTLLRREGDYWTVSSDEGSLHLKDSRGLQTLHRLVSHPDQEFHATDLAADGEGRRTPATPGSTWIERPAIPIERGWSTWKRSGARRDSSATPCAPGARRKRSTSWPRSWGARWGWVGASARRARRASARRVTVQKRIREAIRKIGEGAPALGAT
jgi:hypothetical protein